MTQKVSFLHLACSENNKNLILLHYFNFVCVDVPMKAIGNAEKSSINVGFNNVTNE